MNANLQVAYDVVTGELLGQVCRVLPSGMIRLLGKDGYADVFPQDVRVETFA